MWKYELLKSMSPEMNLKSSGLVDQAEEQFIRNPACGVLKYSLNYSL